MEIRRRVFDVMNAGSHNDRSVLFCFDQLKKFFSFTDQDKVTAVVSDKRPRDKNYYEIRMSNAEFGDLMWRNPRKTRWNRAPYVLYETRQRLRLANLSSDKIRYIWLEI